MAKLIIGSIMLVLLIALVPYDAFTKNITVFYNSPQGWIFLIPALTWGIVAILLIEYSIISRSKNNG